MQRDSFSTADLVLLLIVLLAAGGVRAGYLSAHADGQAPVRVQGDEGKDIKELVHNLSEYSGWFGGRTPLRATHQQHAHTAPGYPWLLSLLARPSGDWEATVRWATWIQAGLGTLTAALYYLFARRAFASRLAATLAGLLCALHPFWVINTAEINDGVLSTFLLAACLFLGVLSSQSHGPFTSLLYGLTLAGLSLVRAALLPFAFVMLLWFLWRCRTVRRGWFPALLAFLGFANGLLPWTIRNAQVVGDVVPLVDSTSFHLWVGNNARATGGPQTEQTLRSALAEDTYLTAEQRGQLDPHSVRPEYLACFAVTPEAGLPATMPWAGWYLSRQERPVLPRAECSRLLAEAAWKRIADDPAGTLQRRLGAGPCFLFGEEWLTHGKLWRNERLPAAAEDAERAEQEPPPAGPSSDRATPQWLCPSVLYGTLLGMFLLSLLGWRWSYVWRRASMPLSLAFIWIPLPYVLSHAEVLSGPRLPLDGVFLCYAAFALACLIPGVGPRLLQGESQPSLDRSI